MAEQQQQQKPVHISYHQIDHLLKQNQRIIIDQVNAITTRSSQHVVTKEIFNTKFKNMDSKIMQLTENVNKLLMILNDIQEFS